jgi:hypothetical protein
METISQKNPWYHIINDTSLNVSVFWALHFCNHLAKAFHSASALFSQSSSITINNYDNFSSKYLKFDVICSVLVHQPQSFNKNSVRMGES